MWDAVRKIFRHDDASEDDTAMIDEDTAREGVQRLAHNDAHAPIDNTPVAEAPIQTVEGARTTGSPAAPTEVSPPEHATQGLAADAGAREGGAAEVVETPAHTTETVNALSADPVEPPTGSTTFTATPIIHGSPAQTEAAPLSPGVETLPAPPTNAAPPETPVIAEQGSETAVAGQGSETAVAGQGSETAPAVAQGTAQPTAPAEPERGAGPASASGAAAMAGASATPVLAPMAPENVAPDSTGSDLEQSGELFPAGENNGAGAPLVAEAQDAPAPPSGPQAAVVEPDAPAADAAPPVSPAPLAEGTVIGERYTITGLVEATDTSAEGRMYEATDSNSWEQCWSCGSTGNERKTRFCQNCGAPIQNHPVTLIETAVPSNLPGEIEWHGVYLHVQPERRLFGAEGIGIEVGAHSAEGPHHPNEDSYWYTTRTLCANSGRQSLAVALLADGMGGYAPGSGLISSRIVAMAGGSILRGLDARPDPSAILTGDEAEKIVRDSIATANQMVLDEIARTGEMGATLVVTVISGDTAYLANIGDSRAYYIDPRGQATPISRDQSLVAQEVQYGRLDRNDIYTALGNNIILHAVGEADVEQAADWYTQPLEPGGIILLCSDGYWKTMRGTALHDHMMNDSATLSEAARRMVDDALAQGSDDNTTVVLIAVS